MSSAQVGVSETPSTSTLTNATPPSSISVSTNTATQSQTFFQKYVLNCLHNGPNCLKAALFTFLYNRRLVSLDKIKAWEELNDFFKSVLLTEAEGPLSISSRRVVLSMLRNVGDSVNLYDSIPLLAAFGLKYNVSVNVRVDGRWYFVFKHDNPIQGCMNLLVKSRGTGQVGHVRLSRFLLPSLNLSGIHSLATSNVSRDLRVGMDNDNVGLNATPLDALVAMKIEEGTKDSDTILDYDDSIKISKYNRGILGMVFDYNPLSDVDQGTFSDHALNDIRKSLILQMCNVSPISVDIKSLVRSDMNKKVVVMVSNGRYRIEMMESDSDFLDAFASQPVIKSSRVGSTSSSVSSVVTVFPVVPVEKVTVKAITRLLYVNKNDVDVMMQHINNDIAQLQVWLQNTALTTTDHDNMQQESDRLENLIEVFNKGNERFTCMRHVSHPDFPSWRRMYKRVFMSSESNIWSFGLNTNQHLLTAHFPNDTCLAVYDPALGMNEVQAYQRFAGSSVLIPRGAPFTVLHNVHPTESLRFVAQVKIPGFLDLEPHTTQDAFLTAVNRSRTENNPVVNAEAVAAVDRGSQLWRP